MIRSLVQLLSRCRDVLFASTPSEGQYLRHDGDHWTNAAIVAGDLPAPLDDLAGLADPDADRVLFWDDSAGKLAYLTVGTNLSITDTTLNASGGSGGSTSPGGSSGQVQYNNAGAFAGAAKLVYDATGKVGVGTGTPTRTLDVVGTIHLTGVGNDTSIALTSPTGKAVSLQCGGAGAFFQFQDDGFFGVRAAPRSALDGDTFGGTNACVVKVSANGDFGLGGTMNSLAGNFAGALLAGTATGTKLGFLGATPVARQSSDVGAGLVALGLFSATSYAAASLTGTIDVARLPVLVGDSGSGGTAGIVPAPASGDAAAGKYLAADGTWSVPAGGGDGGGGSGTVTSVGLSLPSILSVSGSPVTTSGTLTATLTAQAAGKVFAGPASGDDAAPTFRALTTTDIPDLSSVYSVVGHTHTVSDITDLSLGTMASQDAADYYTAAATDTLLAAKADTSSLGTMASETASDYYTSTQTDTAITTALSGYSPLGHTHTASEITDFSTAVDARITAAVGSTVQAYDADLSALAGLTGTGLVKRTGNGTAAIATAGTDYLTPSGDGSELTGLKSLIALRWVLGAGEDLTTGTNKAGVAFTVPFAGTIQRATISAGTGPSGADLIVDLNLNGTSIWATTPANRLKIAAGDTTGSQASFDTTAVSQGDAVTIDVDQVGNPTAGQNVLVELWLLVSNP